MIVRPCTTAEIPPPIPYIPGQRSHGGGCEHWHRPWFPCGNAGLYMVGEERLCWSHTSARIRQLMFQKVPIEVEVAA